MGKRVVLIQCTDAKRDEKAPAKDLYDESSFFRAQKGYAKAKHRDYKILSGKHGLVDPETVLEPYDAMGLSESQCVEIAEELAESGYTYAEIVAGDKEYANPLTPELEKRGMTVVTNFSGLRIGEREKQLNIERRKLMNQQLC